MQRGRLVSIGLLALVTVGVSLLSDRAAGQTSSPAAKAVKSWVPPRTPDGQPDLQGTWTNYTATPFETFSSGDRPRLYAGDIEGTWQAAPGDARFPNDKTGRKLSARKSLVVDPPSGRVPVMAWAERQKDESLLHVADSWEYQTAWERCITRGIPGGMFPADYNSGYRILQTPGYVVIFSEMIHDARVIPLDGRAHAPAGIRLWNGDSRGRWEGDTLVVDITNFNDKGNVATNIATQRIRALPQSEALHVVERFTRVDANTINYEVTIDDPKVFTAPWTLAAEWTREESHQLFEYACHEGNYGLPNILSAGRAKDRADEEAAKKRP